MPLQVFAVAILLVALLVWMLAPLPWLWVEEIRREQEESDASMAVRDLDVALADQTHTPHALV